SIFNALANVVPTHLLDRRLQDFSAMRATGTPDEDGDLAFDVDVGLEAATEAMAAIEGMAAGPGVRIAQG
ncbi:MAG: hypothetical protein ABW276_09280, partial [Casimicrobiaceae bacterium]